MLQILMPEVILKFHISYQSNLISHFSIVLRMLTTPWRHDHTAMTSQCEGQFAPIMKNDFSLTSNGLWACRYWDSSFQDCLSVLMELWITQLKLYARPHTTVAVVPKSITTITKEKTQLLHYIFVFFWTFEILYGFFLISLATSHK